MALVAGSGAQNSSYKAELSEKSVKGLDKLERKDKNSYEVVIKHLRTLEQNPKCFGKPLKGSLSGLWSCRADDFRIIYQVNEESKTFFVVTIARREDVYGKEGGL